MNTVSEVAQRRSVTKPLSGSFLPCHLDESGQKHYSQLTIVYINKLVVNSYKQNSLYWYK